MTSITPAALTPQLPMLGMMPGMPNASILGAPVYITSLSQLPVGAVPISNQMLAQALGQSYQGAAGVDEGPSPLSSMAKGAATGAVAGAALGALPFLPLGFVSGAIAGAGVGAVTGLITGLRDRSQRAEAAQLARAQAQMIASTPAGARSSAPAQARRGVVMGKAMRRTWALKVQAERAAARRR